MNADPRRRAEDHDHHASHAVTGDAEERERGPDTGYSVENQRDAARLETALQQAMVNVIAIRSENGLVAEKAPDDGKARIEDRDSQGHHRRRHSQDGGRLLRPEHTEAAQKKADHQAARVAQKDGSRIEIVAEETDQSSYE